MKHKLQDYSGKNLDASHDYLCELECEVQLTDDVDKYILDTLRMYLENEFFKLK